MREYPYINTTGKLREFISMISSMGVPESVSTKWLPTIGFGSTNHRRIIGVMRSIGFVAGNKPTQRWVSFRDASRSKQVMAEALRDGYADLFSLYPNAHERNDLELKNYFKGQMKGGEQVIANTVSTFKALCSFADFGEPGTVLTLDNSSALPTAASESRLTHNVGGIAHGVTINIDIHLNISEEADTLHIDKVFRSMGQNLLGLQEENKP